MSSSEEEYALAAMVVALYDSGEENESKQRRKCWVNKWLLERPTMGTFSSLFRELAEDEAEFKKYIRVSVPLYHSISDKIWPTIEKQDTIMREAIPAAARLEATLLYLITGLPYSRLQYHTRISSSSLQKIIPQTCQAIFENLKAEYMKTPTTAEEWQGIAKEFFEKWQFPNCLGALDGKHVVIQLPPNSGSYYNFKGTNSIVLMAAVNASYEFIYVDVGANGRISDGGVCGNCSLSHLLEVNRAAIPEPARLPGSARTLPYVFVGDDAFPLKTYLMKQFPFRSQNDEQRIYSYRVSSARRIVENAFGIMASRFRVLRGAILPTPEKVEKVVMACVVLHNLLRRHSLQEYMEPGSIDKENEVTGELIAGAWREETRLNPIDRTQMRNPSAESKQIRQQFCEYFNNEGQVPWQRRMAGLE